MDRRIFLCLLAGAGFQTASAQAKPQPLVVAARKQLGVTVGYDPNYRRIGFPNGDVPPETGVCTDVIIRALRHAYGFDLQADVNRDMKANFSAYPKTWGLKGADSNIDHRRVPNLEVFFKRKGWALRPNDALLAGDILTYRLMTGQPHIAIVSDRKGLIIHNIGQGAKEEGESFGLKRVGHFRINL